jgi:D-3-phosphoglycerate dehydrogenase
MTAQRVAISPSSFAAEDDTPIKMLEEAGYEVVPNPFGRRLKEDEIIEHLKGIDGLIAGLEPLNRNVLSSTTQLKALARVGIGVTNVDFEAAEEFGIKVSNTPDGPVQAVAELTMSALLALLRNLVSASDALHNGEWKKEIGSGLTGKKVLLVGYGRIGRKVSELLSAFGADIQIYDPYIKEADALNVVTELSEGLKQAEVISLHASGTDCILDAKAFTAIQPGTVLLNPARGELVDEQALCKALDDGTIGSGWFDAFIEEPYTGPLTQYPQMLLTPHTGTYTLQCRLGMETAAVNNLLRDLEASS